MPATAPLIRILAALVCAMAPGAVHADVGVVQKKILLVPEYTTVGGQVMKDVKVGYETYGELNAAGDNAVFVAHFFTGTSHAAGRYRPESRRVGYWDAIIGPGRAIDTNRYFVISADTLANANRSVSRFTTGPSTVNPLSGQVYGANFPLVRPRDFVQVHRALIDTLGVTRLRLVIGASAGAIQAMEWAAAYPDLVERVGHVTGPGLAMQDSIARMFDIWMRPPPPPTRDAGAKGESTSASGRLWAVATPIERAGDWRGVHEPYSGPPYRRVQDSRTPADLIPNLRALEELLKRAGVAGALNLDLLALSWSARAYQLYNLDAEVPRIKARVLFIPAKGDRLFPPEMSRAAADRLRAQGNRVEWFELEGPNGHNEGLLGITQAAETIRSFLNAR